MAKLPQLGRSVPRQPLSTRLRQLLGIRTSGRRSPSRTPKLNRHSSPPRSLLRWRSPAVPSHPPGCSSRLGRSIHPGASRSGRHPRASRGRLRGRDRLRWRTASGWPVLVGSVAELLGEPVVVPNEVGRDDPRELAQCPGVERGHLRRLRPPPSPTGDRSLAGTDRRQRGRGASRSRGPGSAIASRIALRHHA